MMQGFLICMDKRPTGGKPIWIKTICYDGKLLFDRAGDKEYCAEVITPEIRQQIDSIRTRGQLDRLKKTIEERIAECEGM